MEATDTTLDADLDLVRKAQEGDTAAFELLYRKHTGRVYAICLRMVSNTEQATLLTQDVFVRAWQSLESFRGDSAFSSWLYRVTVNVVLGNLRSNKRRRARLLSTNDPTRSDTRAMSPTEDAALDLEKAIGALPPQARSVLILHAIEGYQHNEIAELMGIAPGTSKAHLHRARQLLKHALTR